MNLNVLLIGGGGREHALAWGLKRSSHLKDLYIAPGNPGTAELGLNVDLDVSDFKAVADFIKRQEVDLTVVGPEQPLVDGLADYLEERGYPVFGPGKAAAQLEGSKSFAKAFMQRHDIPTAAYKTFERDAFDKVLEYVQQQDRYPVVLKADGLAGGKGVFICEDEDEVRKRLDRLQEDAKLSQAAERLVVEEFMRGEEASVFVVTDGEEYRTIHQAQDHKRIGEGDTGLNTGGMGAYSPAPVVTDEVLQRVEEEITVPTIRGMKGEGHPYKGVLYLGLMITEEGPKVVEYNCRFGDPECQVVIPSLESDLLEMVWAAAKGTLENVEVVVDEQYRCCVVMASDGYPGAYDKGIPISGIKEVEDGLVFQAGTAIKDDQLVTDGGRVLSVVGAGSSLKDAIDKAYNELKHIKFKNAYYRSDIGAKGLSRLDS